MENKIDASQIYDLFKYKIDNLINDNFLEGNAYYIYIPIKPEPHQSVRFAYKNGKQIRYQPQKIVKYKRDVQVYIRNQMGDIRPTDKMLKLDIIFVFKKPKHIDKNAFFKSTRPDLTDNLPKALIDSMLGVVFKDDSQIVNINSCKIYDDVYEGSIIKIYVWE